MTVLAARIDLPVLAGSLLAGTLEGGRLSVHVHLFEGPRDRRFIGALAGRAVLAFVGAAFGVIGALLLGTAGGPSFTPAISLHDVIGYGALFVSAVLMLRVVVAVAREGSA